METDNVYKKNNNNNDKKNNQIMKNIIENNYVPTESEIKELTGIRTLELNKEYYIEKLKEYYLIQYNQLSSLNNIKLQPIEYNIFFKTNKKRNTQRNTQRNNIYGKRLMGKRNKTFTLKSGRSIGNARWNRFSPISYRNQIMVQTGGFINFEEYNEVIPEIFKEVLNNNIQEFVGESGMNFNELLSRVFNFYKIENLEIENHNKYKIIAIQKIIEILGEKIANTYAKIENQNALFNNNNLEFINNKNIDYFNLITKYIFGYFNRKLRYDDIYSQYYKYPNLEDGVRIHKLNLDYYSTLGIDMPNIIVSQDLPVIKLDLNDNYYKYLIIINFIRLRYNPTRWINLNPHNPIEKDLLDLNLGRNNDTEYYNNNIIDLDSFTIRNAIHFLNKYTELEETILIHCGAGFGRTHIQVILLIICRIITKALTIYKKMDTEIGINNNGRNNGQRKPNNNNLAKLEDIKTQVSEFIYNIFGLQKMKELITDKINFTDDLEIYKPINMLYVYRYNTMLLSILYFINKKGLYYNWLSDINIKFITLEGNSLQYVKAPYNLKKIKTLFLDTLIKKSNVVKFFYIPIRDSVYELKDKPVINFIDTHLPENIDDI